MYNLPYFQEEDQRRLTRFMQTHPFAFLTGSFSNGKQVATQVPIMAEERASRWYLRGHIMKHTDHHKAFLQNPQVLAVFTGPHTYVSASWYTEPGIGSTWNYMSVHAAGQIRFLPEEELVKLMKQLTLHFEHNNASSPTVYDNLPQAFLDKMMPAIDGFEIEVSELKNVFKLSQNRDEQSYRNIIGKLEQQVEKGNAGKIADEMRSRFDELFAR